MAEREFWHKNNSSIKHSIHETSSCPYNKKLETLRNNIDFEGQDQLAARLCSVREVIARSLRELKSGGAISVKDRNIYIEDREALERLSQGMWE